MTRARDVIRSIPKAELAAWFVVFAGFAVSAVGWAAIL